MVGWWVEVVEGRGRGGRLSEAGEREGGKVE